MIVDVDDLAIARLDDGPMPELPRVDPQAPGIVICTSGTTGTPKPVVHTARGIWGLIDGVARKPVDPDARGPPPPAGPLRVDSRPMNHTGAIYGLLSTLWRGRPLVVMQRFEPVRYAELVRQYDIETLNLVPTMIRMLLDAGRRGRRTCAAGQDRHQRYRTAAGRLARRIRGQVRRPCPAQLRLHRGQHRRRRTTRGRVVRKPSRRGGGQDQPWGTGRDPRRRQPAGADWAKRAASGCVVKRCVPR